MKNKLNRILSLVMALVMLVCALPMTAAAAESDFKINQYGVLTGYNYKASGGDVVIPDGVTKIGDMAFKNKNLVTSVVIPNGVTEIDTYAFARCSRLTSVTIPNSVTEIAHSAFERCTSLTSVVIPDSIRVIRPSTFEKCTSLTSVVIPDSVIEIEYDAFKGCVNLKSVTVPANARIDRSAFDSTTTVIRRENTPEPITLTPPIAAPVVPVPETETKTETQPGTAIQKFADVTPDSPYFEAINTVTESGLFLGDGSGNFNPDGTVTYAEFAVLLCRIYGLPIEEHKDHYILCAGETCDGTHHWGSAAIQATAKWRRAPDGVGPVTWWSCFWADELMNRGETARYLTWAYFRAHPEVSRNPNTFIRDREADGETEYRIEEFTYTEPATSVDGWSYIATRTGYRIAGVADENLYDLPHKASAPTALHNWDMNTLASAYVLGIVTSDANGCFNPLNNITRGELCQWLYNAGLTAPGYVNYFDREGGFVA